MNLPIAQWVAILRRHILLQAIVAITTFSIACVAVISMPNVYRAETRILVNPQRVSDKYVSSTVSMDSSERLNTLSQQVMSSTRLEHVIEKLNLFPKLRGRMGRDQLIERMRQHITIELKQSTDGPSAFTLSYTGDSASEVAAVTNQLAASFIDWNLRDRESEAEGTTSFLSEELADSKSKLDELEAQLRTYKLQHLGELPDQMQANLQTLSRLQVLLQANVDDQSRLDDKAFLTQIDTNIPGSSIQEPVLAPRQQVIARDTQAHRELSDLRSRYTSSFPDVVNKQKEVDALDSQIERMTVPSTADVSFPRQVSSDSDPRLQLISRDRNRLIKERRTIEAELKTYQARVDAAPIREQEISQLLRDYDTAKEHYKSLLDKTYSAQMASVLESRQEGGTFTMLDAARTPDRPIGPNRPALIGGSAVLAIAFSISAAFLRESTNSTVKSEYELRSILPRVPLLGEVPKLAGTALSNSSTWLQAWRNT